LLVCGDADADAERRSGSSRRFCASDRCRLHDGCIKAIKAAGKLKSSKKRERRMTRLGGVRFVCGVPVQKGCVNNKKNPGGLPGAVRYYFLCGFIEAFRRQPNFSWRGCLAPTVAVIASMFLLEESPI